MIFLINLVVIGFVTPCADLGIILFQKHSIKATNSLFRGDIISHLFQNPRGNYACVAAYIGARLNMVPAGSSTL